MDSQTPAVVQLTDSGDLILPDETTPEAPADKAEASQPSEQAVEHSEATFMPETDVPSGQEKAYRSMQAAFTRKMQELSEKMREADSVREEAKLFRESSEVLRDPEFQKLVIDYKSGRRPQEAVEDEPDVDPATKAYLERKLSSFEEARKLEVLKLQRQMEVRDLAAAHPDWKDHFPAIVSEIQAHPTLSVERAYQNVKAPQLAQEIARLKQELEAVKSGKRKEMSVPPGTRSAAATPAPPPVKDMAEAVQRAIDKINREGLKLE